MSDTKRDDDRPERSPAVYRLTPEEREVLRAEMKRSGQWMKRQLEIDPQLCHLGGHRQAADDEEGAGPDHGKKLGFAPTRPEEVESLPQEMPHEGE
jgi:hypothetical protein